MVTEQVRIENKKLFIDIVNSITRKDAKIEELLNKLEESDFYYAPASTQYHGSFAGGLVDHCLNVYYNLKSMVKSKHLEDKISEDSIAIVGLFHDISKMNYYEPCSRNVKVYSESGSKRDEVGKFDWQSIPGYRKREDRFLYGSHEQTAEYIIRHYIPLTVEESVAILNHMGGLAPDSTKLELAPYFEKYSLLTLLHCADMISTYIDERE